MKLFSLSNELKDEILKVASVVEYNLGALVKFKEYIVLMDFIEKIVITFDLIDIDLAKTIRLDLIEDKIREIVGDKFWVRMSDEVYENSGLIAGTFVQNVIKVNNYIDDSILTNTINHYSKYIKSDLDVIRNLLDLDDRQVVWQIKSSKKENISAVITIVDHKDDKKFKTVREEIIKIEDSKYIIFYFDDETRFKALNKLYILAESNKSSIINEAVKYIL